jgi:hypothetical protein
MVARRAGQPRPVAGFAGTIRAKIAQDFPFVYCNIQLVERCEIAVSFCRPFGFYDWIHADSAYV